MNQKLFTIVEVVVIGALVLFVMYIGGAFKGPEPTPTATSTQPPATATRPRPTATLRATATPAITGTLPAITSPAGLIAFDTTRDGNSEIYVVDAASGVTTNLTNNPAEDYTPLWSPDGSRIAFFSTRTGWLEIYVMNADGSKVIQLTRTFGSNTAYSYSFAWSPDGAQLAAVRSSAWNINRTTKPLIIDLIQSDGSGAAPLYQDETSYIGPLTWSPDGKHITVMLSDSTKYGVYIGKVEETPFSLRPLSASNSSDSLCIGLAWSADGSRLACDAGIQLIMITPDISERKHLTSFSEGYSTSIAWSPDGRNLLFVTNGFAGIGGPSGRSIYLTDIDGIEDTELVNDPDLVAGSDPSWSPDSQWIAYNSEADGQANIYIANIYDNSQKMQLTINAGDNFSPQWQP
jgi:TolB protein